MSKFSELINSDQPVLVDFFAEWCGPCKTMVPILKEVASQVEGKARIIKVDIDKNPAAASAYGVRSVPTLILFKMGKIMWQQPGVTDAFKLVGIISQYE
ncbi:MAG: thioredoxin [Bacteroidetes bacterium]|nr:MAG: thioredoxin [Bacteroidota bacterium]